MNPWDERYSKTEYHYGTEPNDFLKAHTEALLIGKNEREFASYHVLHAENTVRPIIEGTGHNGDGAVCQFIARKPQLLSGIRMRIACK